MQEADPFTGHPSHLAGSRLPGPEGWAAVLDGHRQRLRALDQLVEAARQCGLGTDKDLDIVRLAEDEVSLLEGAGGEWAALGEAIREFRRRLPLVPFAAFGFDTDTDDPFEANTARLRRIGGGVEALAFVDAAHSVYKFFLFREGGDVGATFAFRRGEGGLLQATAVPGSYRMLFQKLQLTHAFGIPTEIAGITPEGIVVAKQTYGRLLPEKTDVSGLDPERLIPIPSRFLRADRDHPRLAFLDGEPWLVADTHDRNVVVDDTGAWRIIDLVAAPLTPGLLAPLALFRDWIERARIDPRAEAMAPVDDDEL
ncbi:MAG TPA: hypothetical protein VHD61_04805 [Lacunisphaera sp.]|nr:hypothetical protein [Lacunisphaera sp.]